MLANALSQARQFGLKVDAARAIVTEVATKVDGWKEVYAGKGVLAMDIDLLAQHIDGDRLRSQRKAFLARQSGSSGNDSAASEPAESTAAFLPKAPSTAAGPSPPASAAGGDAAHRA